ncbi:MAG: 16S rRNA (cytidine(1402)-2'-O)-methyltransferase [Cellvibrionales bacterium]|nr:16S rRNA (cytidine(1402)-2'-O)-methyltransferase [Cellvibrionales bacterium]
MKASLYIVSTPIGNLNDISLRAIETLKRVDCIACEDTRMSQRLLNHYQIATKLVSYHEFSDEKVSDRLLDAIERGESMALISDAGTPLISDPGYRLVNEAVNRDIQVVPIPGSCAFVAALSASGLPSDRFSFEGFLPSKSGARVKALEALKKSPQTLIFYEAPHRILDSLKDMAAILGEQREAVLARELTKTFETIKKLPLTELHAWVGSDANQQKGEMVVLVGGYEQPEYEELNSSQEHLVKLLLNELPPKTVSKIVSAHFGMPKKIVYQAILNLS